MEMLAVAGSKRKPESSFFGRPEILFVEDRKIFNVKLIKQRRVLGSP